MTVNKNTHCGNCGDMVISDLDDFDKSDLVEELSYRCNCGDYYIAESVDEKMKLELFIEYVDKIPFTDMRQLFESFKK